MLLDRGMHDGGGQVRPRRLIPVLREWPGYVGLFVRDEAAGAIPNGRKIVKINTQPGDINKHGATGTVIGSVDCVKSAPELANRYRVRFLYFIEWHEMPNVVVAIKESRIRLPS